MPPTPHSTSFRQPIIGVTASRQMGDQGFSIVSVTEAYVKALLTAGAIPVLIPPGLSDAALEQLRLRLDGILLTGGGDIEPQRYGGQPHPRVYGIDLERDQTEIYLAQQASANEQPFLGICRGLQVLNVALGGTLYEDIASQRPGALRHDYYPNIPREHLAHPVQVQEGSRLAEILGSPLVEINSLHHQAIDRLASSLQATAHAPDGIVEAVELASHPFGMAVQWHPEWLQAHAPMRDLFKRFVGAASQRHDAAQTAE